MALLVGFSGLVAIGSAAPATAGTPVACTEEIGPGRTLPFRPSAWGMDEVTAVTVTTSPDFYGFSQTRLFVEDDTFQPYPGREFATIEAGAERGDYVFSSSAPYVGPVRQPGTYPAPELLDVLRRSPVRQVRINYTDGQGVREFYRWTGTLTYLDCDSDGDGVNERRDVCPTVPDLDQADLDGDRVGDACDPDADGDGVVDTGDNCKRLPNADQLDSDGDGVGDACDATPYPPAPAPSPTGTPGNPTVPTTPGVPGAPVPTAVSRALTLSYVAKKRFFRGQVASAVPSCAAYAEVTLWRKHRRADRRLVISTTTDEGRFRTPRVKRAGKYYVTVAASPDGACAGARSKGQRIRGR
ncbi:thrombospondin type 3 repeat-containing protein [Nocardioides currus]|uniref:thrombospondin type 3 repeat-containing protein n=1 Tax=Nocardioides currus TaxID=2133958 RepID=UPI003C6E831E